MRLPPEFDSEHYASLYPDLKHLSGENLYIHWREYGIREGRMASPWSQREAFVDLVNRESKILEIGPFYRPLVARNGVSYFDVMDADQLRKRAEELGLPTENVPEIDWVSEVGDLGIVDRKFNAVVSAHCIEHQPDLIGHLNIVHDLISTGGAYYLVIPDRRYCFDHFLPDSDVKTMVAAMGSRRHSLASVIEHRAFTTHNDAHRHWIGDHLDFGFWAGVHARMRSAVGEYEASNGAYIDVHAWQFTPESFARTMTELRNANYISLKLSRVFQTPFARQEFCAILVRE